jgi:hypothetical protein
MKMRKTSDDELGGNRLRVSFLYYEECPSHDLALQRLREVMAEEGIPGEVEVIKVETEEQAHELRFVGSPTIRVDGQDIDPPSDSHYALTCRAYRLADGRISPLPSKDMIQRALSSPAKSRPGRPSAGSSGGKPSSGIITRSVKSLRKER